jgi:multicomponent Na+:H+ antiporter subunit C
MEFTLALVVGVLYTAGFYMILRRSIVKLIIGLGLLGHAANLLIFTAGRVTRANPPVISEHAETLLPPFADPLPQALILTAIVIGFGVQAFAIVLIKRLYQTVDTDDFNQMRSTDRYDT